MATKRRQIRRGALRPKQADVPRTEAFQMMSNATKKGRRLIRRVVLKGR